LGQADRQREAAEAIMSGLNLNEGEDRGVLYIVPSGPLYFMPWGALDVNRPVVVLPTGSWLTRPQGHLYAAGSATVIGSPELGSNWDTLPGAREEAERVGKLYGVNPLLGARATEVAIRKSIGDGVSVLHLATHGLFDPRNPLASAILVSSPDGSSSITAARLFEAPLKADLVVLSACETGLGQATAGDDFLGLARSFYLGGARAVVNSLWPVYDKPTQTYMTVFHQKARNGNLGQAWLAARDALKAAGLPPSIYGAFILGGSAKL
jgi:CHAT domain-containing protein